MALPFCFHRDKMPHLFSIAPVIDSLEGHFCEHLRCRCEISLFHDDDNGINEIRFQTKRDNVRAEASEGNKTKKREKGRKWDKIDSENRRECKEQRQKSAQVCFQRRRGQSLLRYLPRQ